MTDTLMPPTVPERPTPLLPRMTFEEFLDWCDGEIRAEWVDGEIVLMSPNSADHQRISMFLVRVLTAFIEARRLGEVFFAPFLMRLSTRPSGREPDILFVAAEHAARIHGTYLDGAADLAIEIVSPESDARDHGEKLVEYETAGIPEYWLIDPLRQQASFHRLGEDGRYHLGPVDADGFYNSAVLPGFRLQVDWLWQRPLPQVNEVLAKIGI